MNRPKKHHYVPECYLKNFTNSETGSLYRLKLDEHLGIRKSSPAGVCYDHNFYSIDEGIKGKFKDLADHDELKAESEILAKSESQYPKWYKTITEEGKMAVQDSTAFAEFIITLKTRTKFWRDKIIRKAVNDNIDRIARDIFSESLSHPVFKKYPLEVLERAANKSIETYRQDPDATRYLQLHRMLSPFERRAITAVMGSKWTLVINDTDIPFVTTDNPGASFNILTGIAESVGFNRNFVFMLPLSQKFLLRIDCFQNDTFTTKKSISNVNVGEDIVAAINLHLISIADNLVISNDKDSIAKYKQIIAKHRLINGWEQ